MTTDNKTAARHVPDTTTDQSPLHRPAEPARPTWDPATSTARHVHTFRVDDQGKVAEHLAVRDDVSMLQQLGHIPGQS